MPMIFTEASGQPIAARCLRVIARRRWPAG
jgi:hypothetical protein